MASKPVRFHSDAETEYLAAVGWYMERSAIAAADFELEVTRAIQAISTAPQRWPSYFDRFRKYTLHQFPFSIIYEELLAEIVVFAVAHGRRKPGYWRGRP